MRHPYTNTSKLTTHPQRNINLLSISLLRIHLTTANATTSQNYPAWMFAPPQPKTGFPSAFAVLAKRQITSTIRLTESLNHISISQLFLWKALNSREMDFQKISTAKTAVLHHSRATPAFSVQQTCNAKTHEQLSILTAHQFIRKIHATYS